MPSDSALPTPSLDWGLFLDVDGTLVEIAESPDGVTLDPRLPPALDALSRKLGGAVALVSGRPITYLDTLFAPLHLPMAGLHGLERRCADGCIHPATVMPAIRTAADAVRDFARGYPDLLVEDKEATVALHYRQALDLAQPVIAFADALARDLDGVSVQKGKMVVEFRPTGANKGTAIETFMQKDPFRGRRPVFIGDDVTDEAGFAVVNRLQGHSIRVGDGERTEATFCIATVPKLLKWLENWSVSA